MENETFYTPEFDISEAEDGWVVRIPFNYQNNVIDQWQVSAHAKTIQDWLDANLTFWEPAFNDEDYHSCPTIMCMWEQCYAIFIRNSDDATLMKLRFA